MLSWVQVEHVRRLLRRGHSARQTAEQSGVSVERVLAIQHGTRHVKRRRGPPNRAPAIGDDRYSPVEPRHCPKCRARVNLVEPRSRLCVACDVRWQLAMATHSMLLRPRQALDLEGEISASQPSNAGGRP